MSGFFFKDVPLEHLIYGLPTGTASSTTQITGSFQSVNYTFAGVRRSSYPVEFYESSNGVYQLGYSIQLADNTHDLAYFSCPNVTTHSQVDQTTGVVPYYANHASFICLAGGGGGGAAGKAQTSGAGGGGGGGGGGGFLTYRLLPVTPNDSYQVQVGAAGNAQVNGGQNQDPGSSGGAGGATIIAQFGTGQWSFGANGGGGGTVGADGTQGGNGGAGGAGGTTDQYSDVNIAPSPGIRNSVATVAGNAGTNRQQNAGGDGGNGGTTKYAHVSNATNLNIYTDGTGGAGGWSGNSGQNAKINGPTVGTKGYAKIYWFRL